MDGEQGYLEDDEDDGGAMEAIRLLTWDAHPKM